MSKAGGYILVEASVAYTILALALVTLLPLFILCFRSSQETSHISLATQLSSELLEEIRVRKWDAATPVPRQAVETPSERLGVEGGEDPGDKRTFDDIDDFKDWAERQPLDPGMAPVPSLEGYSRLVKVEYVDSFDPTVASPTATDLKRVTVCTKWAKSSPLCVESLFANR